MTKNCFIISPIGSEGSDVRRNADLLFKIILEPVLKDCGYNPLRADTMPVGGMINPQIIRHIVEDELAIADLTGKNPNVFYELAIRHVIGKPFIHLIKEGEKIPFDVQGMHTIFYSIDVEKIEKAKEKIRGQISYFEGGNDAVSPFSMTMDILAILEKTNTTDIKLEGVIEQLRSLDDTIKSFPSNRTDESSTLLKTISKEIETFKSEITSRFGELQKGMKQINKSDGKNNSSGQSSDKSSKDDTSINKIDDDSLSRRYRAYSVSEWIDRNISENQNFGNSL